LASIKLCGPIIQRSVQTVGATLHIAARVYLAYTADGPSQSNVNAFRTLQPIGPVYDEIAMAVNDIIK